MNLRDITPLVLTYNEEANIARTLQALSWARRIVVVDSGSTDATVEILRGDPRVQVFVRAFDSHAAQWNYALRQTAIETAWVLALDADYVLTNELVAEMSLVVPGQDLNGYRAPFTYCIDGRPLRGSLYPPVVVLFRRERAEYVQDGHTQRLRLEGAVQDLKGRILHDDRKPRSHWMQSQARYARLEAAKLLEAPWRSLRGSERLRRLYLGPLLVLPYCLLVKGLIFDGSRGFAYSLQRLYAETLITVEMAGRKRAPSSTLPRARY